MEKSKQYPIKAVSLKTGLSIHVIRAWEKRYKAVVPQRTDTNRRLYSAQDIEKLILLRSCTEQGHNIGQVASLGISELQQLVNPLNETKNVDPLSAAGNQNGDNITSYIEKCMQAIKDFNPRELEKILFDASLQLSQPTFLESVIMPVIKITGEMWHEGEIRIMHEHMATATLKTFLSNMRNNYRAPENAPHIIIATPLGQMHELGAMVLSLMAAADGWNVTYLGPDLPAEEIAMAAQENNARAVLLSIVYPANDHLLKKDLLRLKKIVPKNTSLIVGGRLAKSYKTELDKIDAKIILDLHEFKKLSPAIMNGL